MLSALINSEHRYPAMLLAEQLVRQRFVHPGPLVLGTNPLKYLAPVVDRRPTCLTLTQLPIANRKWLIAFPLLPEGSDYTIIPTFLKAGRPTYYLFAYSREYVQSAIINRD